VAVIPAAIARDAFSESGILRPIANLTLPLFTALFATGMVLAASDTAVELLNSLRAPLRRAEVERLAIDRARVDLERELGRHLHASVQSGLIAASYAIQDAVARGDLEAQEAALRAARDLLDARIDMGDGTAATESQVDLCAAVEREWATIITVHWEPAPPIEANTRDVVLLLRECLSNAVIHGHARHATIRIGTADTALLIEVEDDGVGPTGGGTGLGSAVLDDLTHGAWQLTGAPGAAGSIVRARIERSA
jgi:signal transduction histidine kinase